MASAPSLLSPLVHPLPPIGRAIGNPGSTTNQCEDDSSLVDRWILYTLRFKFDTAQTASQGAAPGLDGCVLASIGELGEGQKIRLESAYQWTEIKHNHS